MQEVYGAWYSAGYVDVAKILAKSAGYGHVLTAPPLPTWPATLMNSGLLIVSRYPIVERAFHNYKAQGWYERHMLLRGNNLIDKKSR